MKRLLRLHVLALQVVASATLAMIVFHLWAPVWAEPTVWQIQLAVDATASLVLLGVITWVLPRSLLDRYHTGEQTRQKPPGKSSLSERVSHLADGGHRSHRTFGFADGHVARLAGLFRSIVGQRSAGHLLMQSC